ncbi:ABC transporter substrate-binding protein [Pedobacter duraquae]|uniref:ABC-type branched-subunit amino acid transport system substrate-binding protein n=1 Tax=Pedobacter duraquae TaxID=425511 RepID=A0A4R6IJF0_9SPHI|nr:ABC transporter substrate-binding protein [Pedobacter duraquae]TDO22056.1 hypothetical protein CLV32_3170 [Pedobacter duraquae]
MISVPNLRLLLSGNKYLIFLVIGTVLAACSPKIRPDDKKKTNAPETEKAAVVPQAKFSEAEIALLLPFKLNTINLRGISKTEIEQSALSIDFYQGFKIGLDSAAAGGFNFKLDVYDTRDQTGHLQELINNKKLNKSNLIVGPVFPEGLKFMKSFSTSQQVPMVSPLAASQPEEFNNPFLISIVNNIDLHAKKMGDFISRSYSRENSIVVLINPASQSDEILATPLRKYFQAQRNNRFTVQEYSSVFTLETKLVKGKKYIILLCSSDKNFVTATLNKLVKMQRTGLNADLFGHPDWVKQNYPTDKLQLLNTTVSTSYRVDYKRPEVIEFIKKYRKAYGFEPGEYAFKGFDIGCYFGKLIAKHGSGYIRNITRERYKGLQNNFSFVYDANTGYLNTNLMLLRYKNYDLISVE